jgi:hypothetical protein
MVIWEELPMAKKAVIECANQLLQDIMGNDLPFGGKLFIGLGDFRQVAPVIRGSSGPTATLNSSIRTSGLWENFKILRLTIPIRNAGDPVYSRWVDQVGDGITPYETSVSLQHLRHLETLDEAAGFLFLNDMLQTSHAAVHRAFLSPFNARVDIFNALMLDHLAGPTSIPPSLLALLYFTSFFSLSIACHSIDRPWDSSHVLQPRHYQGAGRNHLPSSCRRRS